MSFDYFVFGGSAIITLVAILYVSYFRYRYSKLKRDSRVITVVNGENEYRLVIIGDLSEEKLQQVVDLLGGFDISSEVI